MNDSQERRGELVVSSGNAPKLFEFADQAFDAIAGFVVFFAVFDRFQAVNLRGNNRSNVAIDQRLANRVAVVGSVHHGEVGRTGRGDRAQDFRKGLGIVTFTRSQHGHNGRRFVRGGEVQLGGEAAPAPAQSLRLGTPFFRGAPAA